MVIKKQAADFHVTKLCNLMGIPRSSYYEFINRKPSNLSKENKLFKKEILSINLDSKRRYGAL